ncbi:SNW domain-containing protein 1 [Dichanthelium oligosanthes]|uniref:SNW domain-containing protein 1 n=1 Tax=Dichanthelium oligosanthes TaxID=888268 RepID=A0A1E5V926_9POAL|nr:SNW domain-containing protein 1 [Dichanthelium oligosanthes]
MAAKTTVPPYGRRAGLVPRRQEDFGGGGAFPEVHVAQYPLSMGLRGDPNTAAGSSNMLAVTLDACGSVAFDAVIHQGENAAKIVYSSHADLVPRITAPDQGTACDDEEEEELTTARTRAALQVLIDARLSAVQPASVRPRSRDDPTFVKYRPARQSASFNSGAEERIVRVEHAQEDPVLPPKHRRRRVPPLAGSPPVTVLHSPPRPVSRKDMEDWKIPPNVLDWKNPKGYCIPLDKRVASDGRRMQDVQVSDGFASLSEALYVAERKSREAIEMRDKVRTELRMKEEEQRERKLREIANLARAEAASDAAPAPPPVDAEDARDQLIQQQWEERMQRELDMVREERRRQRERERRREASRGKKSRVTRDRDRDVGERIALGMVTTGAAGAGEVTYDERLFNQDTGMDSGFAADDLYNVYSGRLFAAQPALSTLYRPNRHGDSDIYGDADEQLEKTTKTTDMFKPDRGFSGAPERPAGKRERPVEFDTPEESVEAYDPFVELDQYMARVKEGKKH